MKTKKLKICAIGDTHSQHWNLKIPACDILIHVGDAEIDSLLALHDFNDWLGTIDVKIARIITMGNHDGYPESIGIDWCKQLFTNAIYLQDEEVTIAGLKFYGSPKSPEFNNWYWMYPRRSKGAKEIWEKIPKDTDVLISHCPPYGILDRNLQDERCGCEVLQRVLLDRNIKHHIFGHLHGWGGQSINQEGINFYNVSVLDEQYKLSYKPTIIEL